MTTPSGMQIQIHNNYKKIEKIKKKITQKQKHISHILVVIIGFSTRHFPYQSFQSLPPCIYCKVRIINMKVTLYTLTSWSDSLILQSVNICSILYSYCVSREIPIQGDRSGNERNGK